MRKLFALLTVLALLVCSLAGCSLFGGTPDGNDGGNGNEDGNKNETENEVGNGGDTFVIPEGLTGIDVIKLLLADERLSGKLIGDSDGIFQEGAETYARLAERAEKNLGIQMLSVDFGIGVPSLDDVKIGESFVAGNEFTEFDEVSRNYEMFNEMTRMIVEQANRASDIIDFVKKNVRILDTWITYGSDESIYLHVDGNSELIIVKSNSRTTACRRQKNELGEDVYELYDQNSFETIRSSYIAGKKYELMRSMDNGARYQGMSASNSKGYWEVFDVIYDASWLECNFETNFIIMKDDICYKAGYTVREENNGVNYTVTTPNRASDILLIDETESGAFFEISLGSFEGYYGVIDVVPGNLGKLKLADGRVIDYETFEKTYYGEYIVRINGIYASESAFGKEGSVMLSISGPENRAKVRGIFLEVLEDFGIECKYDLSEIFLCIDRADAEFIGMRKYLRWNGHDVNTVDGLMRGVDVEKAKFAYMKSLYEQAKNAPSVAMGSEAAALLVVFAPIAAMNVNGASCSGLNVAFENISITCEDMLLFVSGEEYKIAFAMKSLSDGGLTIIEAKTDAVKYNGESTVTVGAEALDLTVPMLMPGEYVLVAYISTADGIRSSECKEIAAVSVTPETVKIGGIEAVASATESGALKITYTESTDALATLSSAVALTYGELYDCMAEIAFEYGIPSEALIEAVNTETDEVSALTGEETEVADGVYRMEYTAVNGEIERTGYVYIELKIEPEIPETATDPEAQS